jgi:TnpA family transposase
MAGFLSDVERTRLNHFPAEVPHQDMIAYFTLSPSDRRPVPKTSAPFNRLGFALQLGALRYLGFCPKDVATAPRPVVAYVAEQLGTPADCLKEYGSRSQTRTDHALLAQSHLGFRKVTEVELEELGTWLVARALEHDRPLLLLELACERLRGAQLIRPDLQMLERLVVHARHQARRETYRLLSPMLTDERKAMLDALLVTDEETGRTPLAWLRQEAISSKPRSILETVDKLRHLQTMRVADINLDCINPNRRKFLAQLGRTSVAQAIARMSDDRRYPILLAVLERVRQEVVDELVEQFDRCLADTYSRAGRHLEELKLAASRATNEKMRLLQELGRIVLDPTITDAEVRAFIYRHVSADELRAALEECDRLIRPADDNYFDLLAQSYGYLRQFAPAVLEALDFLSHQADDPLLAAIEMLRRINRDGLRKLPADAPLGFVPNNWRPYVVRKDGQPDRHYYELCALWELRLSLRAGDVWLRQSRRYADPASYLIPADRWPELRPEVCKLVNTAADGSVRLGERRRELEELLERFDKRMPGGDTGIRMEAGRLIVTKLSAEEMPPSVAELEQRVDERLPLVELPELLLEVDGWTGFSRAFEHVGKSDPRSKNLLINCHASVLAQACNFGLTRMARIADLTYSQLAWCSTMYLREETLRAANTTIINHHYHHPLSKLWGGGTLSSSDGQRFPVGVQSRHATAIPRYFGFGRGLTFYTWTSDQFSQYGSKPIPSTTRDATYVLDSILDNETELPIAEHTTDTAGYTDIVFALFDLLGLQFAPRLRDIADQKLYRVDKSIHYQNIGPLVRGTIDPERILKHWDDLLRVAGSLKLGWVTASLFIGKLQSYRRKNALTRALQEYGQMNRTIFILRYLEDEAFQRRIGLQLNKGEALHALRNFLFLANQGQIRRGALEDQTNQAQCLNLVTNAVVLWNTVYMSAALDELRAAGHRFTDDDVVHLSPARFEHINPYGRYHFDPELAKSKGPLRPLRRS